MEITAHEDVLLTVEGYRSGNYTTRRGTTPRSKATVVEITAVEGVLLPVDASGRDGRGYRSGNYSTRRCTTPRSRATVVEITALEDVLLLVDSTVEG